MQLIAALRSKTSETRDAGQACLQAFVAQVDAHQKQSLIRGSELPKKEDPVFDKAEAVLPSALCRKTLNTDLEASWEECGNWLRIAGSRISPALRGKVIEYIRRLPRYWSGWLKMFRARNILELSCRAPRGVQGSELTLGFWGVLPARSPKRCGLRVYSA